MVEEHSNHTERVAVIEQRLEANEKQHDKLNGSLERIWEAIDDSNTEMRKAFGRLSKDIERRVPRGLVIIITLLSSATIGLLVALFK